MVDLTYKVLAGKEAGREETITLGPGKDWVWGRPALSRTRLYDASGIPGLSSRAIVVRHRSIGNPSTASGVWISTQQGGPRTNGAVGVYTGDGRLVHRITGHSPVDTFLPEGRYILGIEVLEPVCTVALNVDVQPPALDLGTGSVKVWDFEELLDDDKMESYVAAVIAVTVHRNPALVQELKFHAAVIRAYTTLTTRKTASFYKVIAERCERDRIAVIGGQPLAAVIRHYDDKLMVSETDEVRDLILDRWAQAQN